MQDWAAVWYTRIVIEEAEAKEKAAKEVLEKHDLRAET